MSGLTALPKIWKLNIPLNSDYQGGNLCGTNYILTGWKAVLGPKTFYTLFIFLLYIKTSDNSNRIEHTFKHVYYFFVQI